MTAPARRLTVTLPLTMAVTTATTALLGALAAPASAGPPVVETVDRTFTSPFLSSQCGVPVTQHLVGEYRTTTHRSRTITVFRFRSTLTAGDGTVDSRAFGPEIVEVQPDGSTTITQLGVTMRNIPGTGTAGPFAGRSVTVITAEGEELEGPSSGLRTGTEELCAALTA